MSFINKICTILISIYLISYESKLKSKNKNIPLSEEDKASFETLPEDKKQELLKEFADKVRMKAEEHQESQAEDEKDETAEPEEQDEQGGDGDNMLAVEGKAGVLGESSDFKIWSFAKKTNILEEIQKPSIKCEFQENEIKIRNGSAEEPLTPEEEVNIQILFSTLDMSCEKNGAIALCSAKDYYKFNNEFKNQAGAVGLVGPNQILESNQGETLFLLEFKNEQAAQDFKLYSLQLFLKNSSRTSKTQLASPKGFILIDNNAGFLVLKQDKDGTQVQDSIPVDSIKSQYRKANSNVITIHQFIKAEDSQREEQVTLVTSKQPGVEPDMAGKALFRKLDSLVNIQFQQWLKGNSNKLLRAARDKKKLFDEKKNEVPIVYKYPLKTMKIMDNEFSSSDTLSCHERNKQVMFIAKDFSFSNQLIFNEVMYLFYVVKVFPKTSPSYDGVKFTSDMELAKPDCFLENVDPNFHIVEEDEDSFKKLQDKWLELIDQYSCLRKDIPFEQYKNINETTPSNAYLNSPKAKEFNCIEMESKYVPGTQPLVNMDTETALKTDMINNLIVKEGLLSLITDPIKPQFLVRMLDKQPVAGLMMQKLLVDLDIKEFEKIDGTVQPKLTEFGTLQEFVTKYPPKDWFKVFKMPLKALVDYPDIVNGVKSKMVEQVNGEDVGAYWDKIEAMLKESLGFSLDFQKFNEAQFIALTKESGLTITSSVLEDPAKLKEMMNDPIKFKKLDSEIVGISHKATSIMESKAPADLLKAMGDKLQADKLETEKENQKEALIDQGFPRDAVMNGSITMQNAGASAGGDEGTGPAGGAPTKSDEASSAKEGEKEKGLKEGEKGKEEGKGKEGPGGHLKGLGGGSDQEGIKGADVQGEGKTAEDVSKELAANPDATAEALSKISGKILEKALLKVIENPGALKALVKADVNLDNLSQEELDDISKAVGLKPPGEKAALKAKLAKLTPEEMESLLQAMKSNVVTMDKAKKDKAVAEAMKDPAFRDAMAEQKGLMASLAGILAGSEMIAAVGDIDNLLDDPEKMAELLSDPKVALEVFGKLLGTMSAADKEQFGSCLTEKLAAESKKGLNSKQQKVDTIFKDTSAKIDDKILKTIKMAEKPALVDECIANTLAQVIASKGEEIKGILAQVLGNSPDIALSVANQNLLDSMDLTQDQLMAAIGSSLKDPSARLSMLRNLIKLDKIETKDAPQLVEQLGEAKENISNDDLQKVWAKQKSSFIQTGSHIKLRKKKENNLSFLQQDQSTEPTLDDLKTMADASPDPFVPESVISLFEEIMKNMSPAELNALAGACIKDEAFTNALMENNPELSKQMAELAKDAEGSKSASESLLALNLSPEEKKAMLVNGVESKSKLAHTTDEIAQELNGDQQAVQDTVAQCRELAASDNNAKPDLESIDNISEPIKQLTEMHKKDSINSICEEIFKKAALQSIKSLDNAQIESAFETIASNPMLAKLLAEANPEVAEEIALKKDPKTIFGPDGKPIDPNMPLTRENVDKLTALKPIDDTKAEFEANNLLIQEGNQVKDMTDVENPINQERVGELTEKQGQGILTKALSAQEAADLKAKNKLVQDLNSVKDDLAMEESLEAEEGEKSSDKLLQLEGSKQALLSELKRIMGRFTKQATEGFVKSTCTTHETLVEGTSRDTTDWLVKNKLVEDLVLTMRIEEWTNKAIKAKVLNHASQSEKKRVMANFYQIKEKFDFKPEESVGNVKDKVENVMEELAKFTLCTDFFEFEGCGINIKPSHINFLLTKQELAADGKPKEPLEDADLRSFQFFLINQVEFVNKFPVFMIRLKNEFNNNGSYNLPPDMQLELARISVSVVEKGQVNIAFLQDLQDKWLAAITSGVGKETTENELESAKEAVKSASKKLLGLPNVMESYVKLMQKPCDVEQLTPEILAKAKAKLSEVQKGIKPEGNFWMVQKLNVDMADLDKMTRPTAREIKKGLQTINRFRSTEQVQRSNDILNVIDEMLRGKDLNRNFLRDIQMVFFMSKGDLFLDQLPVSNQKIRDAQAQANGG